MSAEVVKKRGRPKKVVPEIEEVELPETVKNSTTRTKSTKTAAAKPVKETTKTAKSKTATAANSTTTAVKTTAKSTAKSSPVLSKVKAAESVKKEAPSAVPAAKTSPPLQPPSKTPTPIVNTKVESQPRTHTNPSAKPFSEAPPKPEVIIEKTTSESIQKPGLKPVAYTRPIIAPVPNPVAKSNPQSPIPTTKTQSQSQSPPTPTPTPVTTVLGSPVTPATSQILSRVRELSQKNREFPRKPAKPSVQQSSTSASAPSVTAIPKPAVPSAAPAKLFTPSPTLKTAPQMPPPSQPNTIPKDAPKKIPVLGINKEVVSNITARAGARPNPAGSAGLPPNYKATARKVTFAIVAAPIAIVTSYVLYQRLILGEDQKHLVRPGLNAVETSESEAASSNFGSKST